MKSSTHHYNTPRYIPDKLTLSTRPHQTYFSPFWWQDSMHSLVCLSVQFLIAVSPVQLSFIHTKGCATDYLYTIENEFPVTCYNNPPQPSISVSIWSTFSNQSERHIIPLSRLVSFPRVSDPNTHTLVHVRHYVGIDILFPFWAFWIPNPCLWFLSRHFVPRMYRNFVWKWKLWENIFFRSHFNGPHLVVRDSFL